MKREVIYREGQYMKSELEQGVIEWGVWTGLSCMCVKDWCGFDDERSRTIRKVSVHIPHGEQSFPALIVSIVNFPVVWCSMVPLSSRMLLCLKLWCPTQQCFPIAQLWYCGKIRRLCHSLSSDFRSFLALFPIPFSDFIYLLFESESERKREKRLLMPLPEIIQ